MFRAKYAIAFALALAMAFGAVGVASAAVPSDSAQLRQAVTVGGILEHEREFQAIADANEGTRRREPRGTRPRPTTSPASWRAPATT